MRPSCWSIQKYQAVFCYFSKYLCEAVWKGSLLVSNVGRVLSSFFSISNNDSRHSLIQFLRIMFSAATACPLLPDEKLFCFAFYFCFDQTVRLPNDMSSCWLDRPRLGSLVRFVVFGPTPGGQKVGEVSLWSEGLSPSDCLVTVWNHRVIALLWHFAF